jgi:hypothetical protein
MRADATSAAGTHRLAFLLAVLGLMMALVLPTTAAAQFKDDDRDDEDQATEEATEETDDEATEEADDEEATEEAADPEDLGLVDDGEYESPQFGYAVEWSRDWDLDTYYEEPLISDEEIVQDRLYLIWTGVDGEEAYVIITGQEASRGGVDEDVAEWTDPDYIEEQWEEGLEVEAILDDSSGNTGAVLFSLVDTENDDAQYFIMYAAVELDDGSMIYVTFTVFEDYFENAYLGAADLLVDGESVLNFLAWDDIEEAIADL